MDFANFPSAWEERWGFIRYFIDCWFEPIESIDGYSSEAIASLERRLASPLPELMRCVLQHSGCRRDLWQSYHESETLFQKLNRVDDWVIVTLVIPLYAFPIGEQVDPELIRWHSKSDYSEEIVGRLSDVLLAEVVEHLWSGKGSARIPHFTKSIMLDPSEVKIGSSGEWLQKQEVASRLISSPKSSLIPESYHARDLVVSPCYPNTFRIAARTREALTQLPQWLRDRLETDKDSCQSDDYYRKRVGNKPIEQE